MKAVILALVIIAGAFAHSQEEMSSLWSAWKQAHKKDYSDAAVEAHRFNVFRANYKYISEFNAKGNTASLALNQFADLTSEEFAAIYTGAFAAEGESVVYEEAKVGAPDSWDWRSRGAVTPVKNQGQCGSCWAFATVATIESLYIINKNSMTLFSEQQIVDCDKADYGCSGGWPYKAITYVQQNGLETGTDYPYTAKNGQCQYASGKAVKQLTNGYAFVTPRNPDALKAQIFQAPVVLIIEADQSVFQFYSGGVITTGCGVSLNHAVTGVGYGDYNGQDAFFVKNSWGTNWGVQGYVYISTSSSYNSGLGACGVLSQPQYPK